MRNNDNIKDREDIMTTDVLNHNICIRGRDTENPTKIVVCVLKNC